MKKEVLKVIARIVVAVACGIAIGYLTKLNLEAGVPVHVAIGVAAGMILLIS